MLFVLDQIFRTKFEHAIMGLYQVFCVWCIKKYCSKFELLKLCDLSFSIISSLIQSEKTRQNIVDNYHSAVVQVHESRAEGKYSRGKNDTHPYNISPM